MPDRISGVWLATDPAQTRLRQWGQEWLVFHEPSGETHLLGPLAVSLFQRLQAGGGPEALVLDAALADLACPGDPELEALARQTLDYLLDIGLARFIPQ